MRGIWYKILGKIMSIPSFLGPQISNIFKVGRKSSAFTPLIWLLLVAGLGVYKLLPIIDDPKLKKYLIYMYIGLIGFICLIYLLYWIFKPARLHSETYLLEDKRLEMIRSKGRKFDINAVDLNTPTEYRLEEGGKND